MTLSEQSEGQPVATTKKKAAAKAPARRNVDKAFAKAGKQAKEIIEKTKASVAAQPHPEWLSERAAGASDTDYADGCRVRELREQGLAWWAIGNEMGLPGSGPSAATGKTGAGHARRLYKKAFGEYPRTHTEPRGEGKTAKARKEKAERVLGNAAEQLAVMTDTEACDYLAGKWIQWVAAVATAGEDAKADMKCKVGKAPKILEGKKGRFVTFNEPDAGSRSIYLASIHTVTTTEPRG